MAKMSTRRDVGRGNTDSTPKGKERRSEGKAGQPVARKKSNTKESDASRLAGRARKALARRKGLKPGSRQNPALSGQGKKNTLVDPRLGSKKPIPLGVVEAVNAVPGVVLTAAAPAAFEQELAQLELNERLDTLLDAMEAGETLSAEDTRFVEQQVTRHDELLHLLGLADED